MPFYEDIFLYEYGSWEMWKSFYWYIFQTHFTNWNFGPSCDIGLVCHITPLIICQIN